jgi:peptide/nickel transport system permease protein
MANYALRRVLQSIPILFILSVLLFAMVRAAPGGPLSAAYRNPNVTKEQIELLKKQLGLDQPLPVQYARWMGGILRGDLGESIKFRRPVAVMIAERVPNTLVLVGVSFLVTLIVALPVGILSARKPYSWFDSIATTLTFIGQSVPVYWLGLALILVFYVAIQNPATGKPLFPAGGMRTIGGEKSLADLAWHLVLPVIALSASWIAWYSRFLRSSLLDVLHEDYVRTARA